MALSDGIFCADYVMSVKFANHSYLVFNDTLDALIEEAAEAMRKDKYHLTDLIEGHVFRTAREDDPRIICLLDIVVKDGQWEFEEAEDADLDIAMD